MEKEFFKVIDELKEKIEKGDQFFDLIAQAMKELDEISQLVSVEGKFKCIMSQIKRTKVEVAMFEALERKGYPEDKAIDMANVFIKMIPVWE